MASEGRKIWAKRYYEKNKATISAKAKAKWALGNHPVEKRKAYNRKRYQERKAIIDALKAKPCMDCGNCFPPYVMDWHHRDPKTKVFKVATGLAYYSWAMIVAEVNKCDLLCSNCHRIREWGENGMSRKAVA